MDVKYISQSLGTKPWVKAFAIIDPSTNGAVYATGSNDVYTAEHAKCLMDPSNKLVGRAGKWSTGVFWDDGKDRLDIALARDVGGYTVIVEAEIGDMDSKEGKKGAKSLANAAKHALKTAGMYHALYENC